MKTSELTGAALDWAVAKCEARTLETVLINHDYRVGERDPAVNPEFTGEFMVTDPLDTDGYAIVGDDYDALVIEAHDHLLATIEYSTDWAQGGPIIDREFIGLQRWNAEFEWAADIGGDFDQYGETPLIAAMRCYVASKLGDEVELPEELEVTA
jgi:hypothetical protein